VLAGALILVAPYAFVHLTARATEPAALALYTGLDTSPVYGTGEAFLTAGRYRSPSPLCECSEPETREPL